MRPASIKEAQNGYNNEDYITPRTLSKVLEGLQPSDPDIGGTNDYKQLVNLPKINDVTLLDNVSLDMLGVQPAGDYAKMSDIPSLAGYLTKQNADDLYQPKGNYQETLVSGSNIKTINGETILGSGDITITGGGGSSQSLPVGSIYASDNDTNPSGFFGGTWQLVKNYSGGELIAYATVNATSGAYITNGAVKSFASNEVGANKTYNTVNYVPDILRGQYGAVLVNPQGIVGMVEAEMHLSGYGANGLYGFWWHENGNTLPSGVEMISGFGYLSTGPIGVSYGGNSSKYIYKVDGATESFYVNPTFAPYGGAFTPGSGGVYSHLVVKAFAKAGTTYIWKRTA